jgi:signal recognition particle subunit SRP54
MFDALKSSLSATIKKISNSLFVDDKLINELVRDLQRALLSADINVKLVFAIAQNIKDRIKNEQTPSGLSKKDHLIHILYDELTQIVGGEFSPITITRPEKNKPFVFMMVGLFGNGKTTTCGKLAKYYIKRGYKVGMISTDTWRPAAYEQLRQIGKQIDVPVFGNPSAKSPVDIFNQFSNKYAEFDILIVDTAGRDALNEELVTEITELNTAVAPHQTILVLNADIGQAAQKQAELFHTHCSITGVIVTKLDGTAKGGGALTACHVVGTPIKFIGVGEKVDDFEEFKPKNFIGELLGMGDLEKLLTKASEAFDKEETADLSKRMLKGEFTLIDLYDQMQAMKKMGPLNKLVELIPGMGGAQIPKELLANQEGKMESWKFIMDSCTKLELEDPTIMNPSRIMRVARGSGREELEVRELIKHYKQSKKMMKMFKGVAGGMENFDGDPSSMSQKDQARMMKKMGNMKGLMQQMSKGRFR